LLGISRRTLLRKLKLYRETNAATAETLGLEQYRFYRKQISLPIRMRAGDEWLDATLMNISLGGAAVSIHKILSQGTPVLLSFTIPETSVLAEISGRVAWANSEGHHGIQFGQILSDVNTHLQSWFQSEMKKDGWQDELVG
jgi:Tfp pilus assembly protein PilZ